ncbi:uncharacterized protein (TIGR02246 family) [Ewingella americana]|jgi:uncharacterized protein (TIGR02246 family)
MNNTTPASLIEYLMQARARRDIDAVLACYEPDATLVLQSGETEQGLDAIRIFSEKVMDLPLQFSDRKFIQGSGITVHNSNWKLSLPKEEGELEEITGKTVDIIRQQVDGSWLLAIDNPWA